MGSNLEPSYPFREVIDPKAFVMVDNDTKFLIEEKVMEAANPPDVNHDAVNYPSHYTSYQGLEIIDLTEQLNFNRGNAVKYICRAGLKNKDTEIQDLEKASWYIQREIRRLNNQNNK